VRHVVLTTVALLACDAPRARRDECPSRDVVEALHAAAFHFEHGSRDAGHAALTAARSRLAKTSTAGHARDLLGQLDLVERILPTDAARARSETEWIRLSLQDWACLSPTDHTRFHEKLPPVP
jgi:hypothetical protein